MWKLAPTSISILCGLANCLCTVFVAEASPKLDAILPPPLCSHSTTCPQMDDKLFHG
jgi:hypothetical protein